MRTFLHNRDHMHQLKQDESWPKREKEQFFVLRMIYNIYGLSCKKWNITWHILFIIIKTLATTIARNEVRTVSTAIAWDRPGTQPEDMAKEIPHWWAIFNGRYNKVKKSLGYRDLIHVEN